MGFLNKILSSFEENTYERICKAMIHSYDKIKKQNLKVPKRELYALTLSLRPTWERESPTSFIFNKGGSNLVIEEKDKFRDVVRNVIIIETKPSFASSGHSMDYIRKVVEAVKEAFKDFEE